MQVGDVVVLESYTHVVTDCGRVIDVAGRSGAVVRTYARSARVPTFCDDAACCDALFVWLLHVAQVVVVAIDDYRIRINVAHVARASSRRGLLLRMRGAS